MSDLLFISSGALLKFQVLYFSGLEVFLGSLKNTFHVSSHRVPVFFSSLSGQRVLVTAVLVSLSARSFSSAHFYGWISLLAVGHTSLLFCMYMSFCLDARPFLLSAEFCFIPVENVGLFLAGNYIS